MDIKEKAPSTFADVLAFALGGIERQEADGQRKMIAACKMPIQGPWIEAVALGIIQGESDGDLFYDSTLPEGWQIKRTDHSMWSDLLDEKGRKRGGIFYKAAFYDRSAHWHLNRRFSISYTSLGDLTSEYRYAKSVFDHDGTKLFDPAIKTEDQWGGLSEKTCEDWLEQNYPDHKQPTAYWD